MVRLKCIALLLVVTAVNAAGDLNEWTQLERGLELAYFTPQGDPDAVINILRINPIYFDLKLFNASAGNKISLTPKQWAQAEGLVAVINASMFQQDFMTSVSFMRSRDHVNNSYVSKDKTILAFDPSSVGVPKVKIIDRECEDFDSLKKSYNTLVQSIRMISCKRENVWRSQSEKWSVSAIGVDKKGRVLFIQTESAFDTHELINVLLLLPLNIQRAMYVEGGPQAQLYINSGGRSLEFVGQVSSFLQQGSKLAWPIPNVIGIARK